jgi:serine/threonine protein kinase
MMMSERVEPNLGARPDVPASAPARAQDAYLPELAVLSGGLMTRKLSAPEEAKYVLESLREGADFALYRGIELGTQMPILALAVAADQPSPLSLRRLEHEYSLVTELGATWAAQPLALTRYQGRAVLMLKDPGGEPLDRIIERHRRQPIALIRFLRIAIGLAVALGQAHRQGLIHKNVKPANALVDDSGHVWLTGFGIASQLPREHLAPAPPEIIAGTLAYMSPEQTGRMNRSIDSRSDLYSLGVTLYEMLTGALPFAASDPMGWVYCHIARKPVPPIERLANVPAAISAIVMKLLAKPAEERYQTAAGLEHDLRYCPCEWVERALVPRFLLAQQHTPDRLVIPEKLYGRDDEVAALNAAFGRCFTSGKAEVILVSGYSGVGKSSVVNELHKVLLPRGLFAAGKFDEHKRDIPYARFQAVLKKLNFPP